MLFNSFSFLAFLVVVLLVSRLVSSWTIRKAFLLVASYLFYAAWNPPFVALLWISTVADWYLARGIYRSTRRRTRRLLLLGSLTVNLGLLAYFKYSGFLVENFEALSHALGFEVHSTTFSIVLPVGISFYTFQTLSYTLDVYRGVSRPWHSFLDYALYVTFFPQLVAGPIVRAVEFLPQCEEPRRASGSQLGWGFVLLTVGLFNKTFIADSLAAPIADAVFRSEATFGLIASWGGTLAFAVQIFCDFAGYSTCAIGVALMLGFRLPDNFRFPYAAIGFSDFWRRWHISLSTWLRDYLYISLGGNRKGKWKTYRNLSMTMLLGGLWHGASWNFVVWGGLHGAYLVLERLVARFAANARVWRRPAGRLFLMGVTFVAVCFAWVYFRAGDFDTANRLCASMLGFHGVTTGAYKAFTRYTLVRTYVLAAACVLVHLLMRDRTLESVGRRLPWPVSSALLAIMVAIVFLSLFGEDHAFIYFQF